jgi:DNA-directed RNA polymerase subunit M/transcription elongation factor TFIIS
MVNEGTITEAELCPSCGSGKLILQGRALGGKMIRELVCISCRHSWRVELPEFHRRLRP